MPRPTVPFAKFRISKESRSCEVNACQLTKLRSPARAGCLFTCDTVFLTLEMVALVLLGEIVYSKRLHGAKNEGPGSALFQLIQGEAQARDHPGRTQGSLRPA